MNELAIRIRTERAAARGCAVLLLVWACCIGCSARTEPEAELAQEATSSGAITNSDEAAETDEPEATGHSQEGKGRGHEMHDEDGEPKHTNRLVDESSPYLLQHAHNPVDWYPWGDEAFAAAKEANKPIFLSVGYSTCHWCHVMERESFESEEIAAVMNEHFVCIKVDREERPDVDAIYMAAVQALNQRGGWPMSVFMTPDRKPFFGGTYFPPVDRGGRVGFKTLLLRVSDLWNTKRADLETDAARLTEFLEREEPAPDGTVALGSSTLDSAYGQLERAYDPEYAGFGRAPKFPRTSTHSFLLRYAKRTGNEKAQEMATESLRRMWRGGMYDHLGGGFHRYSTDREWLLPHFEKMLYDQALISRTYLEAYQVTGDEFFADVVHDVFRYVLRDMTDERGGFYSAEDADSEGEEGLFYLWTYKEILDVLGVEDGRFFCEIYGVELDGNFLDESKRVKTGENILHLAKTLEESAAERETTAGALEARLAPMRAKLFDVREPRIHPYKDDKVLADWNGLMISAFAMGGQILGEPKYTDAARAAARFVLDTFQDERGRLLHRYRGGKVDITAFLEDYAFLSLGLLDLYEATFEPEWLAASRRLAHEMIELFRDDKRGAFFLTGDDAEKLITRTKEIYDGAIPSGNSVAALVLLRLGRLTSDAELESKGRDVLATFASTVARGPSNYPMLLHALDFEVGPSREIVLAGRRGDPALESMADVVRGRFLPNKVVAFHPVGDAAKEIRALVPFLTEQVAVDGKPTAYVCENYACKLPVHDPDALAAQLE